MDKRLPHRIRDLRQEFVATGRSVSTDSLANELCRRHSEYKRIKAQPLRRMISQELSTPVAAAAPAAPVAAAPPLAAGDGGSGRKRQRPEDGAAATEAAADGAEVGGAAQAVAAADAAAAEGDPTALNGSLRRMYNPNAKPLEEANLAKKVQRLSPQEQAARAAARRERGLHGAAAEAPGGFTPEERPQERFEDLAGIDSIVADLKDLIVSPLMHPEVFAHLGAGPIKGVLLHGPPGSGKTKLAHAIAGTTGVTFFKVAATEIVSGMSGESEAKIRQLFKAAVDAAPALLFLDEVDAICPKRDSAGREMERRIVAQLLCCMDDLTDTNVVVMGATNRPDALDPALRRGGRFDREIMIGIPDEAARARILETKTRGMRLSENVDFATLARQTPGYVGADLQELAMEAARKAVNRGFDRLCQSRVGKPSSAEGEAERAEIEDTERPYTAEEMSFLAVDDKDFEWALSKVQPSSLREGFTTVPNVRWEDIGALQEVRSDLDAAVCAPIRKAALFKQFGQTVPVGVLLFGPPGCGKTLLAKAVANASGANFIAVKGPELMNKYVGESERAVRLVFQRASSSRPCVIFFDELDALVPKRQSDGSNSSERVVNQMLTEMDGVHDRSQVYVIAATNRPDIVDPAMLRPGRLDRLIYVPLPSNQGRLEILQAHTRKIPLGPDVDLVSMAKKCDGYSGADLASLVREAAMLTIDTVDMAELGSGPDAVAAAQVAAEGVTMPAAMLERARERTAPSVGAAERKDYESLAERMCNWKRKEE